MNEIEHGMASHNLLQWPNNERTAHRPRKPPRWERLKYGFRVRWKEGLVALTFWAFYSYACAACLSR